MTITKKTIIVSCLVVMLIVPLSEQLVFGHGGSAEDRAPIIDFENKDVTVMTKMNPPDMTVGNFSNAFLEIKFVEELSNSFDKKVEGMNCTLLNEIFNCTYDEIFPQTTYRVTIEKQGKLLARHMFYAENGILTIDIRPNDQCNIENEKPWKCAKVQGTQHPIIEGALYTFGQNNPVIDGSVFTKGGLYNIQVEVIGANSPRSNFKEPLEFDLYVSITQEQHHTFEHHEKTIPISIKTYFDDVSELQYSEDKNKFSFSMPFDWNPLFADNIVIVHHELMIPKSYHHYDDAKLVGIVDGVILEKSIMFDPLSKDDSNIIHFMVNPTQVKMINQKLGDSHMKQDTMKFEIVKDVKVAEWIKTNAGWWCDDSISEDDFITGIEYLVQNQIIKLDKSDIQKTESDIPFWVKQNACWWSENKILNHDFVSGIEFLIKEGMIKIT